jgi:tmRNA-binding protein
MEIGLARGKKIYDRREDKMKRDISRETERDYKLKLKG